MIEEEKSTQGKGELQSTFELLEQRRLLAAHIVGNSTSYSTIQAAVNAASAGATINVDAGTYNELVTVNKQLTIRGAQADIDPRLNTRRGGTTGKESILDGKVDTNGKRSGSFLITANNVVIDGFTVQGNTDSSGSAPAGIVIAPQISGTQILNNLIQNNVTGLYLSNYSSADRGKIVQNVFLNNNNPGTNSDRGIYSDESVSGGNLTNVLIDSNMFVVNSFPSGASKYEGGIALESYADNSQSNISLTNNVWDGVGKLLFFNITGLTIEDNTITHNLDHWSCGIRLEGGVHDATIKFNTIYNNTGLGLDVDSKGYGGDDSDIVATNNNFFGNDTFVGNRFSLGVTQDVYDGVLDAEDNYWGSSSGPGGQGPGSGDKVYGNAQYLQGPSQSWSLVAGDSIDYSNWSTSPIGSIESPYFGIASVDGAPIQAEDYDNGGSGIAYHDADSSNSGGKYRTGEGVDIESTKDTGGGYDVTSTKSGEWLNYTVNLSKTGTYQFDLRAANSSKTSGKVHLDVDGVNVTGSMSISGTGGSQTWKTFSKTGIKLSAGQHVLELAVDSSGMNFNWLKLTNTSVTKPTTQTTNLSSLNWASATAGWGTVQKNASIKGATAVASRKNIFHRHRHTRRFDDRLSTQW